MFSEVAGNIAAVPFRDLGVGGAVPTLHGSPAGEIDLVNIVVVERNLA